MPAATGTTTTSRSKTALTEPTIEYDNSVSKLLGDDTRPLVCDLLELLAREADSHKVPAERLLVRSFVDPEEGDRSIVIVQYVRLPVELADSYWDSLEKPLERWQRTLSGDRAELAHRMISVRVRSTLGYA